MAEILTETLRTATPAETFTAFLDCAYRGLAEYILIELAGRRRADPEDVSFLRNYLKGLDERVDLAEQVKADQTMLGIACRTVPRTELMLDRALFQPYADACENP